MSKIPPKNLIKSKYVLTQLLTEDLVFYIYNGYIKDDEAPTVKKAISIWKYKKEFLSAPVIRTLIQKTDKLIQLKNSNILATLDYHYDGKFFHVIQESLENLTSLEEYLKITSTFSLKNLWKISTQIISGMLDIENKKLVCGNLNLRYIYINKKNQIKLTNVCLSTELLKYHLSQFEVLDDCLFYAPEFLHKQTYTIRSDIYSFGILLYVFFSKKRPYEYTTKVKTIKNFFLKNPHPFHKVHESVPDKLIRITEMCIEKNPGKRFPSFTSIIKSYKSDEHLKKIIAHTKNTENIQKEIKNDIWKARKRSFMQIIFFWSLLLISTLTIFSGYYLYLNYLTSIPDTVIPDIVNQPQEIAEVILKENHLNSFFAGSRTHPRIPAGYIVETKPPAGRAVKQNRTIRLYLSRGNSQILVPDLVGRTTEQSKNILKKHSSLIKISEEIYSLQYPINTILSQQPGKNTYITTSENIHVVISKGFPVSMQVYPVDNWFNFFQDKTNIRKVQLSFYPIDNPVTQKIIIIFSTADRTDKIYSAVYDYKNPLDLEFELDYGGIIKIYFEDELGFEDTVDDPSPEELLEEQEIISKNIEQIKNEQNI
ncbi:MAG: protein kinase [bacterium]|nr:protein kinase [bacterium]